MNRQERITIFVSEIWRWYARHKRVLPWRDLQEADPTQRAYPVFVSEIMLQQTQVPRVEVVFRRFIREFPTLEALAAASDKQVLVAWRGMGYNSRALRMRDAARTVLNRFGGVFPSGMEELLSIKGIGRYTAGAIRNFAFGLPTPCIDTNIRRILHRAFVGPENPDGTWEKDDAYVLKLAEEVLEVALEAPSFEAQRRKMKRRTKSGHERPKFRSSNSELPISFNLSSLSFRRTGAEWHAALMDFGSLVCTKNNPKWDLCPLTAQGVMKAAYKVPRTKKPPNKEPGRLVGSVFVPNRIFRGRIVEQLRDERRGLSAGELGPRIAVDWNAAEHREWLNGLLRKLRADGLIASRGGKFTLPG